MDHPQVWTTRDFDKHHRFRWKVQNVAVHFWSKSANASNLCGVILSLTEQHKFKYVQADTQIRPTRPIQHNPNDRWTEQSTDPFHTDLRNGVAARVQPHIPSVQRHLHNMAKQQVETRHRAEEHAT